MGPTLLPEASKNCTSIEESCVSGPTFAEASQVTTKPPFDSPVTVGLSFTKLMPLVSTSTSPPTLLPWSSNLCAMIEPERVASPRKKLLSRQVATKPPLLAPLRAAIDTWSWSFNVIVLSRNSLSELPWTILVIWVPSSWNNCALISLSSRLVRSPQLTTKLPFARAVTEAPFCESCVVLATNSPPTLAPSAWYTWPLTAAFRSSSEFQTTTKSPLSSTLTLGNTCAESVVVLTRTSVHACL